MRPVRFGLIGSGFIGRAHAMAFSTVGPVFGITAPRKVVLADSDPARAGAAAAALGFERSTGDWRDLLADPEIDVVDICTPNHLHREMALAAVAAGKHVYCEKPLAITAAESREVAEAARAAGVVNLVGFNYVCNPLVRVAREMIVAGEIGEIQGLSGCYLEDYMADPAVPWSWRCVRELAGAGALADLGTHLINAARTLAGPITRVNGSLRTLVAERRDPATGRLRPVENEDVAHVLVEFAGGVQGTFDISRSAAGYKCGLRFSVFGSRGTLEFDQERMNELRLYRSDDAFGRRGFRTILTGPEHPDYRAFCPAPGHGLGYNDLKVIEVRNVVEAVTGGRAGAPDFAEGWRVQQVVEAIERSHIAGGWIEVGA